MTRDEVLDVLDFLVPLKRRRIDRSHVPVQFIRDRIAVILPKAAFTQDERIRLEGKFQYMMRQQKNASAYLDFVHDWKGLDTRLEHGMT